MKTLLSFKLCNEHLIHLYEALQRNDVSSVYEIEHYLTPEEECVACAYVLHSKGEARDVLEDFLEHQGLKMLSNKLSVIQEFKFWTGRMLLFGTIFFLTFQSGIALKKFIFESVNISTLGVFGWLGIFIISLSLYTLIEYRVIE